MSKLIPLILVVLVLGGGTALAFYAFDAAESYPSAGDTANSTASGSDAGTTSRENLADREANAETGEPTESNGETTNDVVLEADAAQLYETILNRELPLGERRAAAIKLGKHTNGEEFVEKIVRDDSFIRAGEGATDPVYMVDMNVFIALLMNIRYDTSKPVLIALTDHLDDTRRTRMLRDNWMPEPPATEEADDTPDENASGSASEESGESGNDDAPPGRRDRGRTRMTGGVGGIIPSANSVELREYAMMALQRALNQRLKYDVEAWLTAIEEATDE